MMAEGDDTFTPLMRTIPLPFLRGWGVVELVRTSGGSVVQKGRSRSRPAKKVSASPPNFLLPPPPTSTTQQQQHTTHSYIASSNYSLVP